MASMTQTTSPVLEAVELVNRSRAIRDHLSGSIRSLRAIDLTEYASLLGIADQLNRRASLLVSGGLWWV